MSILNKEEFFEIKHDSFGKKNLKLQTCLRDEKVTNRVF
jgi:hypothetical protein